jgi:hypothetical protein
VDVGRLVATSVLPEPQFLQALITLAHTPSALRRFASATQDTRMSPARWRTVVSSELLHLLSWSLRRASVDPAAGIRRKPIYQVLSLLPSYGTALHIIRRGAVFAGLGVPTVCGFPEQTEDAAEMTYQIGRALAIERTLTLLAGPCTRAGMRLRADKTTVVVTGRDESVSSVARSYAWQRVVGSAGCCTAVVGADPDAVLALARALKRNQLERSCARVGAVMLSASLRSTAPVRRWDGRGWAPLASALGRELERVRPSIVATPAAEDVVTPTSIVGYRLVAFDPLGVANNHVGFGADPVHHWPGDYTL